MLSSLPLFIPPVVRIWTGLLATRFLNFTYTDEGSPVGCLLEVAALATGDAIVRIPHPPNMFMRDTDMYRLTGRCYHMNQLAWVPNEDYYLDRREHEFWFSGARSRTDPVARRLTPHMRHWLRNTPNSTDLPAHLLCNYNNPMFVKDLFVMLAGHKNKYYLFRKYMHLGPDYLTQAMHESQRYLVDTFPYRLQRTIDV